MTSKAPVLLNVERQGLLVILHVRGTTGEETKLRCGPNESIKPRAWEWSGSTLTRILRDDPTGYLSVTGRDGQRLRFAVGSEEQVVQFKAILNRPVA